MVIVLCDEVKKRKVERDNFVSGAATTARQIELDMLQRTASKGVISELSQICCALLAIAQKYVPNTPTAFVDAADVAKCAKALEGMSLRPKLEPHFKAHVAGMKANIVLNSFEYRYLRNKAIAGFATLADLTSKPSAVGTLDYQSGVREGYRRASEVAIIFLSDIQNGVSNGR